MTAVPGTEAIAESLRRLCAAGGPEKSICPSEVARALAKDPLEWRSLMPAVRDVAAALQKRGEVRVLQRGQDVDPETARGAIRLTLNAKPHSRPKS